MAAFTKHMAKKQPRKSREDASHVAARIGLYELPPMLSFSIDDRWNQQKQS
jgi:hypothetical protein